ncbi:hypothetical protein DSO57_1021765 [Entomophthora muscae]|uniref:Uncharacterized protein n=1 Tax=Entomophthora muscae TaxID=34485 RepID=A0ACC2TQZ5_9FUNG|nr:hypothetical protein DSO57_1021765 [Entomophthora muscae]
MLPMWPLGKFSFRTMMGMNSQLNTILGSSHPMSNPGPSLTKNFKLWWTLLPIGVTISKELTTSSLNILPNLLIYNPSMFPSNAEDNPQIILIPTSAVLLPTLGLLAPLALVLEFPLVLPGSLLHDVVSTQYILPDCQVILSKLSPEHPLLGPYVLKERIVYQNNRVWVPKSLRERILTEHHDPPLFGHPGSSKLMNLV